MRIKRNNYTAFTLLEVLFAAAIFSTIFITTIMLIQFHRIQSRKAMEQSMMLDFMQHYLEIARQNDIYLILPGEPINTLFDGNHGAPDIRFPSNNDWNSLWTEDFKNFHPDLEWFRARSPEYKCIITNQLDGSELRSKHLHLEVRWHPPLGKGKNWLTMEMDTMIYRTFN